MERSVPVLAVERTLAAPSVRLARRAGIPVAIAFGMGDRARGILDDLKAWMGLHNAAIMAVLCLVIGAKLAGDGLSGLGS